MYVQFLDQNNPESEISARREILKPFKKLALLYYQVLKLSASPRVFKLDNTLLLVFETVLNRLAMFIRFSHFSKHSAGNNFQDGF